MLNCKETTHLISEAQDRSLSFTEKAGLETHLLMCSGCRRYREQMVFLRTLCRQYPDRLTANPDQENSP